jgi:hypothetical protein
MLSRHVITRPAVPPKKGEGEGGHDTNAYTAYTRYSRTHAHAHTSTSAAPKETHTQHTQTSTVAMASKSTSTATGAEAMVRALAEGGVEVCFANPGTTEMWLVGALDKTPAIRPVLGLHETVCAGAADGYGRMARKPACTAGHPAVRGGSWSRYAHERPLLSHTAVLPFHLLLDFGFWFFYFVFVFFTCHITSRCKH